MLREEAQTLIFLIITQPSNITQRVNNNGLFDTTELETTTERMRLRLTARANVYVTGESFGSGTRWDYATIKYNSAGREQWVARYNGPNNGDDGAEGIAVDGSGNAYVTGVSRNADGFSDYVTIKYNSAGQELWVARYYSMPGNYPDEAAAIAI